MGPAETAGWGTGDGFIHPASDVGRGAGAA